MRLLRALAGAGALAGACTSMALIAAAAEIGAICPGLEAGPARTVARVLDGETVALDDGTELRLIGALAPRAIDADAEPGAWPAETAATDGLRALVLGKSIELALAGERTDRYGRLQAHAFLIEGEERRWVQGYMLQHGFARAYALTGSLACSHEMLAAERQAREARRGVWAEASYHVRTADKPAELLRHRTTFQIVDGVILRVGQTRGTIYLNFHRNWRRGFSASLRRDDRQLLGSFASDPKGLEGRSVRVRGWIERRGRAPVIDLSAGGLIEVLNGGGGQPDEAR